MTSDWSMSRFQPCCICKGSSMYTAGYKRPEPTSAKRDRQLQLGRVAGQGETQLFDCSPMLQQLINNKSSFRTSAATKHLWRPTVEHRPSFQRENIPPSRLHRLNAMGARISGSLGPDLWTIRAERCVVYFPPLWLGVVTLCPAYFGTLPR